MNEQNLMPKTEPKSKRRLIMNKNESESSSEDDVDDGIVEKVTRLEMSRVKRARQLLDGSDSSDDDDDIDEIAHEPNDSSDDDRPTPVNDNLKSGDYVVVKLNGLQNVFHYIAVIVDPTADDLTVNVNYLEKQKNRIADDKPLKFCLPESSKTFTVPIEDIVASLPKPMHTGGTKRVQGQLMFETPLAMYNLA